MKEPEIIFGKELRGDLFKIMRRDVYDTVEHINSYHPAKITKVVCYQDKKTNFVVEMWCGGLYSKQKKNLFPVGNVSAEKGVLYAHSRCTSKAAKVYTGSANECIRYRGVDGVPHIMTITTV